MTNAHNESAPQFEWGSDGKLHRVRTPKATTPTADSDTQARIDAARAAFEQAYIDHGGDPKHVAAKFDEYLKTRDERRERDARQRSKAWLRENF